MGMLDQKVALITGGGKGIGKGIALAMAREGARLVIGCHSSRGMAEDTLRELQALTPTILVQSDVGTLEGCQALVDAARNGYGRLDILVNNAAIQTQHPMLEGQYEDFLRIIRINLRAAYLMMQKSLPLLKASGQGRVILISSVHGKRPTDFDAAYAVSKGGLKMLCREAAIEFAPYGITVNIIAPGGVAIEGKTGNPAWPAFRKVERARHISAYPLGRVGLPSDSGELACYIASEKSEHLSGASIRLDGCAMLL